MPVQKIRGSNVLRVCAHLIAYVILCFTGCNTDGVMQSDAIADMCR